MFFSLWIALIGCGDGPIIGRVVNTEGQGINGVNIQLVGSQCTAQSDKEGHYEMTCPPGQWTLEFRKLGFVTSQVLFDASDTQSGRLPVQSMIAIPNRSGLFIKKGGDYQNLSEATLTRSLENQDGKLERRYCLQSTDQTPMVVAPTLDLYDHRSQPWRLFALNEDRCAYSDTRSASGRWSVGYRNKPDVNVQAIGADLYMAQTNLAPGHYFIAYWDGFFVPSDGDASQYIGHWFQVEG